MTSENSKGVGVPRSGYESATPALRAHVEVFERVLTEVRRTHGGKSVAEAHGALADGFAAAGLRVNPEVLDEAARMLADADPEPR